MWNGVGRKVKDKNTTQCHPSPWLLQCNLPGRFSSPWCCHYACHRCQGHKKLHSSQHRTGWTPQLLGPGHPWRQRSSWVRPQCRGETYTMLMLSTMQRTHRTNQSWMTTRCLKGRRVRPLSGHRLTEPQLFKSLCPRSPVLVGLTLSWMVLWEATMALLYHPGA